MAKQWRSVKAAYLKKAKWRGGNGESNEKQVMYLNANMAKKMAEKRENGSMAKIS